MFLGIEIGGTKLQLALSDQDGCIRYSARYAIHQEEGAESIRQQILAGWKALSNKEEIEAIGVGFGGPVNWKTGTIRVSHQVAGWADFNLSEWLHQVTRKPVMVENDANTAGLAEALYGSGKGYDRVFYMTIGSGIGGSLIIDQNIYHGQTPGEVEIGHLRLNKEGDTLESKCSGWAINKKVRSLIEQQQNCLLAQLSLINAVPEAMLLKPALESGDVAAKKIMEEVADDVALALSHIVHLFHPDIMIIGGGISLLREHLLQPIVQQLPRYVMDAFLPPPPTQTAALGELVVPIGAMELARRTAIQKSSNSLLAI